MHQSNSLCRNTTMEPCRVNSRRISLLINRLSFLVDHSRSSARLLFLGPSSIRFIPSVSFTAWNDTHPYTLPLRFNYPFNDRSASLWPVNDFNDTVARVAVGSPGKNGRRTKLISGQRHTESSGRVCARERKREEERKEGGC